MHRPAQRNGSEAGERERSHRQLRQSIVTLKKKKKKRKEKKRKKKKKRKGK